jgi:dihydrofolate reductase
MRDLIYSMNVSLDGYIADARGAIDWGAPDPELHKVHNDQARETGVHLLGRRLYETMVVWETDDPERSEVEQEFAQIWKAMPKVVFSTTLLEVEGNSTLVEGDPVDQVRRLKEEPGEPLAVGGAGLASTLVKAGLVDEFRVFFHPVLVGGGTPFFPALEDRIRLDLVETRTFGSTVVYSRYRRKEA